MVRQEFNIIFPSLFALPQNLAKATLKISTPPGFPTAKKCLFSSFKVTDTNDSHVSDM